MLSKVV